MDQIIQAAGIVAIVGFIGVIVFGTYDLIQTIYLTKELVMELCNERGKKK